MWLQENKLPNFGGTTISRDLFTILEEKVNQQGLSAPIQLWSNGSTASLRIFLHNFAFSYTVDELWEGHKVEKDNRLDILWDEHLHYADVDPN